MFILSISQLGYRPKAEKQVTLIYNGDQKMPESIPFYIQKSGSRLKRKQKLPEGWKGNFFRWPFDIGSGEIDPSESNEKSETDKPLFKGWLKRKKTRWGTIWQGNFSEFILPGIYQIETQFQTTVPFEISETIYERVIQSYLRYIYTQRSGKEIPGIRPAEHLDDGILDYDGTQVQASGGWYDAGDYRKWLALTQQNIETLCLIANSNITDFSEKAREEIKWGNKFFHAMMNSNGQLYEDIGGGAIKEGLEYEKDWWFENHPGCNATSDGNCLTDNVLNTNDERIIRTTYNPLVQYQFVKFQLMASDVFSGSYGTKCRNMALKAWEYGQSAGHDNRTLFLAAEALSAIELYKHAPDKIPMQQIKGYIHQLIKRQNINTDGITGYFMEKDGKDGFRSIIYAAYPAMALYEASFIFDTGTLHKSILTALENYIENYLLADAKSNPFGVTPYGIYHNPPFKELQTFRHAGKGKYIRTFIHPINTQEIIHGTSSVLMAHALLLCACGHSFNKPQWVRAAEKLVAWNMGHNIDGVSLFNGIGYRHPVAYSSANVRIPDFGFIGYIGTPEDKPYQETSNWVEWSTQEKWDVPIYFAANLALRMADHKML